MTTAYGLGHALGMEKAALDPKVTALLGGGVGAGLGGLGGLLLSDKDRVKKALIAALLGGVGGAAIGGTAGLGLDEISEALARTRAMTPGLELETSGLRLPSEAVPQGWSP